MTGPAEYAVAVFRAYEALQVGTDPQDIDAAERALRAANGQHPLLQELCRKSALMRRRTDEPPRDGAGPSQASLDRMDRIDLA